MKQRGAKYRLDLIVRGKIFLSPARFASKYTVLWLSAFKNASYGPKAALKCGPHCPRLIALICMGRSFSKFECKDLDLSTPQSGRCGQYHSDMKVPL